MRSASPPALDVRVAVVTIARLVPPGRVVSYGDIAELVGVGPRYVARIVAHPREGEAPIPWWRITNAAGDLPLHLHDEAFARYRQEGTALKRKGRGAAIGTHRADLPDLADAAEAVLGPLPGATADQPAPGRARVHNDPPPHDRAESASP